jgi:hypothetical protein
MVKRMKPEKVIGFRASGEDQRMIDGLKTKLGIRADSEILRQALRCLAQKERVK